MNKQDAIPTAYIMTLRKQDHTLNEGSMEKIPANKFCAILTDIYGAEQYKHLRNKARIFILVDPRGKKIRFRVRRTKKKTKL